MRYRNKMFIKERDTIINQQNEIYNYSLRNYNLHKYLCFKTQKFNYCNPDLSRKVALKSYVLRQTQHVKMTKNLE